MSADDMPSATSFASRPGFLPRPVTLGQALREIALMWRNRPMSYQERMREAQRIERLAQEIDEEPKRTEREETQA